ncbi:MAG: hypothetical protein FWE18_04480 [Alphaproteobacteria bacterium]|nr:hypothetical protein [Alphaproteobacteria bacterium]
MNLDTLTNINEMQGMLFLSSGSNAVNTIAKTFEITFNSYSINGQTHASDYKSPIGSNFINYIKNEELYISLNDVQFKNI